MIDLVAALVARLAPVVAPALLREGQLRPGDPFPAAVIEVVSQVKTPELDGDDGLVDARVQFSCVAYAGRDAQALAAKLRDAVRDETGWPNTWGADCVVHAAWWDDQYRGQSYQTDDSSARTIHEIQLDLNVTYEG